MRCYEHNNTVQTFTYGTRFLSSCTDKLVFVTKTNKLLFVLILMPIVIIIIIIITMVIRDTDSDVCWCLLILPLIIHIFVFNISYLSLMTTQ